jgi:hypothetical protein
MWANMMFLKRLFKHTAFAWSGCNPGCLTFQLPVTCATGKEGVMHGHWVCHNSSAWCKSSFAFGVIQMERLADPGF